MGCDNFIVDISYIKVLFKTIKVKKGTLGGKKIKLKVSVYQITSAMTCFISVVTQ